MKIATDALIVKGATTGEALQAIVDYVATPRTDFALLITGPWGCGKTYFWRRVAEPKIRQMACDGGHPWRTLYATAYGCESTSQIDAQLMFASYPRLQNRWTQWLGREGANILRQLAEKWAMVQLPAVDLRWLVKTKGAVLCVDDLERSRIPIKTLLGYVNTFVEHEGVKTVILCNEDMIGEDEERKAYGMMREKVVGARLLLQPDVGMILNAIIEEYTGRPSHGFLEENSSLLRHLFAKSGINNIRVLRRALTGLACVHDALLNAGVHPSSVARQLIYAVAPGTFELQGRGADPLKVRKVLSADLLAVAGVAAKVGEQFDGETSEEKFEAGFSERYFGDLGMEEWRYAVGCRPICDYLLTGVLDRSALVTWAKEQTAPPDPIKERIGRLTSDFREMEDDEFAATIADVLSDVEAGNITAVGQYISLYRRLESFADARLTRLTRQELLGKFSAGLQKAQKAGALQPDHYLEFDAERSMESVSDEARALLEQVVPANEDAMGRGTRERVRELAAKREEDPEAFIRGLWGAEDSNLRYVPVFQHLDGAEMAAWLLSLPNSLKGLFCTALHARYLKHAPPRECMIEVPVLTEIRDRLKDACEAAEKDEETLRLSLWLARRLVQYIDQSLEQLRLRSQKQDAVAENPEATQSEKES